MVRRYHNTSFKRMLPDLGIGHEAYARREISQTATTTIAEAIPMKTDSRIPDLLSPRALQTVRASCPAVDQWQCDKRIESAVEEESQKHQCGELWRSKLLSVRFEGRFAIRR